MRVLIFLIAFLAANCLAADSAGTTGPSAPLLKIDDAHFASSHGNEHAERYFINPGGRVLLDATGYTFKGNMPFLLAKTPNQIGVLRQRPNAGQANAEMRYLLNWTTNQACYDISAHTLRPRQGSPPFPGFKSGERWFIYLTVPYKSNKSYMLWCGVVEVN